MIRLTIRDQDIVQTLRIEADKAFIGRSPSNSIVLKDAAASRKHCMLRVSGGVVEILDLNSRHGLKINGEPANRSFLSVGDRVQIGCAEIRLDEVKTDEAAPSRFGGYLDDDAHLYTIPGVDAMGTATATRPATGETTGTATEAPPAPAADARADAGADAAVVSAPKSDGSFADELYRVLRRAPAWGVSLIVHAFIMALLFQAPWGAAPDDEVANSFASGLGDRGKMLEDTDPADLEDFDFPAPEDEPDTPDLPNTTDPIPADREEAAPLPEPLDNDEIDLGQDDLKIKVTGLGVKSNVKIGDNKAFGKDGSGDANRKASGLVLQGLGGAGGRVARLLRRRPSTETLVVPGTYDRVEDVLDLFEIPYTVVKMRELRTLDLKNARTIFVNCSNEAFPDDVAAIVGKFVHGGGYLFSTDWALENVVEKAFPRTIRPIRVRGNQIRGTPEMVIKVSAKLKRHFFLRGTGLEKEDAQWWLEDSSYPVRIVRPELVEVLVDSAELRKRYGSGAVAVTFRWGQGRVVHVMGHYFQKEGNLRGTYAMQKIITNFLVASIGKH